MEFVLKDQSVQFTFAGEKYSKDNMKFVVWNNNPNTANSPTKLQGLTAPKQQRLIDLI